MLKIFNKLKPELENSVPSSRRENSMGSKFGVIVAFLLALAAAGGSYYLYQNFVAEREIRENLQNRYNATKHQVMILESEKDQIISAKEQYQIENEEYQRKIKVTEGELTNLKDSVVQEREMFERQMRVKEERLAEMQRKIEELKFQADQAMKACNITPSDLKTSYPQAPAFGSTARSASTGTLNFSQAYDGGSWTKATGSSDQNSVQPFESEPVSALAVAVPPAPADTSLLTGQAKVLTVNRKYNFVVVNLGTNDGLKMGDQLQVMKNGVGSATLKIEKLYDKFSAATITDEKLNDKVTEGDAVRRI